jgi:hypothetical protein
MAFGLWDIAKIGIPIAAGVVGTPAAGIAASALMGGADPLLKGKGVKEAALGAGLGAASGAAGGAATGALGKALGGGESFLSAVGPEKLAGLAEGVKKGAGKAVAERAAAAASEAGRVARFSEQMQELGGLAEGFASSRSRDKAEEDMIRQQMNAAQMSGNQGFSTPGFQPWVPMHRR